MSTRCVDAAALLTCLPSETCWALSQCCKFLQAAAPWMSPRAIPRVRIASHSLNCLSFSPHDANCVIQPHTGGAQACSHLRSRLAFTGSGRAAGVKPPFLCQAAAGNLRRHWPTPATSETEAANLEVIYENICNSKKHKWCLRKGWGPKLMSAEMVHSASCTELKREDKLLRRVLGCLSVNLYFNELTLIIDLKQKCWTTSQLRAQLGNLFLNDPCVRIISGTTGNWFEVFQTLAELYT